MMPSLVALLGALVTALCTVLLLRGYSRARSPLLLWSGLCFAGLTLSNALLFVDFSFFPEHDFHMWRLGTAAAAMLLLVYGLVCESE